MNSTSVNMTTTRPETKKKVTRKMSSVNPNATEQNIGQFFHALNSLSENELTNVEKVTKKDLTIPEVI